MATTTIGKTGLSRVFVSPGGAAADVQPVYQAILALGSVSQSGGDRTSILIPSDTAYDQFVEVDSAVGADERVTSSLSGRFPLTARFNLAKWFKDKTRLTIHCHFGSSDSPRAFNTHEKALIFENADLDSVDIEDVGSMEESNPIGGSAEFSAGLWYEVVPLSYSSRASATIVTEILGTAMSGSLATGERTNPLKMYAVTDVNASGAGTVCDFLFSLDRGATWTEVAVSAMAVTDVPTGMAILGDFVFIISDNAEAHFYTSIYDVNAYTTPTFTEVTGYTAGSGPNAVWSDGTVAFVVADAGYIYKLDDISSPTVVDAGVASSENLLCVHGLDSEFILVGGANGAILKADDGASFSDSGINSPVSDSVTAIVAKSEFEWMIGTDAGELWYTVDSGGSWSQLGFSGSGSGTVTNIVFPTSSVGFLTHTNASGNGVLLKTVGGGASGTWYTVPRGGSITANHGINTATVYPGEPNLILMGGLATDDTDGVLILGQD